MGVGGVREEGKNVGAYSVYIKSLDGCIRSVEGKC